MSEPDAPRWRTAFADKVAAAAAGVGEAIARTAGAAATLLTEQDLRKRGAQAIQGGIQGGVRGIQQSERAPRPQSRASDVQPNTLTARCLPCPLPRPCNASPVLTACSPSPPPRSRNVSQASRAA